MIKTQTSRFIPPAPFYTGASGGDAGLGDLILTGFETPAFIPGTVAAAPQADPNIEPRTPTANAQVTPATQVPAVHGKRGAKTIAVQDDNAVTVNPAIKYAMYAAGVVAIGGLGFVIYKRFKK